MAGRTRRLSPTREWPVPFALIYPPHHSQLLLALDPVFAMPSATPEQSDLFDKTVQVAAYRPTLTDNENRLKLIETDEVPPADEQGRRRAEGWKAVWEGFVDPGQSIARPCTDVSLELRAARRFLGVLFEVGLRAALGNFSGNLHGAATAWIVDA